MIYYTVGKVNLNKKSKKKLIKREEIEIYSVSVVHTCAVLLVEL